MQFGTTNDGNYLFYYDDITVTVTGNFGTVSIYCLHHGYMGGQNLLTYSNKEQSDNNNTISPGKNENDPFERGGRSLGIQKEIKT